MAVSLIGTGSAQVTSAASTSNFQIPVTFTSGQSLHVGDLIVVLMTQRDNTTVTTGSFPTSTDSSSNSYNYIGSPYSAYYLDTTGSNSITLQYAVSKVAASTLTVTAMLPSSGTDTFKEGVVVGVFTGYSNWAVDAAGGNYELGNGNPNPINYGPTSAATTIATSTNGVVAISAFVDSSGHTFSAQSGWTHLGDAGDSSVGPELFSQYQIMTANSTVSSSIPNSYVTSSIKNAIIATFGMGTAAPGNPASVSQAPTTNTTTTISYTTATGGGTPSGYRLYLGSKSTTPVQTLVTPTGASFDPRNNPTTTANDTYIVTAFNSAGESSGVTIYVATTEYATYTVSGKPTTAVSGTTVTYNVTANNTGSLTWLYNGSNSNGLCHLGSHFSTTTGGLNQNATGPGNIVSGTDTRTILNANIANGASTASLSVTVNVPTVTANTTYYLSDQMVAEGTTWFGTGGPQFSEAAITVTPSTVIPPVPTVNAPSSITSTGFTATWTDSGSGNSAPASYDVTFTGPVPTNYTSGVAYNVGNVTSVPYTGLASGTTYSYTVDARNSAGPSAQSSPATTALTIPAAPSNTAATGVTSSAFTANWSAVTGASAYYITFTSTATPSGYTANTLYNLGSVTTYNFTGLSSATAYTYNIEAYNSSGYSAASSPVTATTLPVAPSNNPATGITSTGFTANWSAVTGATSYSVNFTSSTSLPSGYTSGTPVNVGNVNSIGYTGLVAGVTYSYEISATGTGGTSIYSNIVDTPTLPAAPSNNPPTSITATGFTANWSAVSGATSYNVTFTSSTSLPTGYSLNSPVNVGNVNSIGYTGLASGTTYSYEVSASDASGAGANSLIVNAVTLPGVPINTAATSITATGFTANWSAVSGSDSYYVNFTSTSTPSGYTANSLYSLGNVTTYAFTGCSPGTTYSYLIEAHDASGYGGPSGTTNVLTLPAAPNNTAATSITTTGFTANWTAVTSATSYSVTFTSGTSLPTGYTTNSPVNVGNVNTITYSGLSSGTTYTYVVLASNANGPGANSNQVSLRLPQNLTTSIPTEIVSSVDKKTHLTIVQRSGTPETTNVSDQTNQLDNTKRSPTPETLNVLGAEQQSYGTARVGTPETLNIIGNAQQLSNTNRSGTPEALNVSGSAIQGGSYARNLLGDLSNFIQTTLSTKYASYTNPSDVLATISKVGSLVNNGRLNPVQILSEIDSPVVANSGILKFIPPEVVTFASSVGRLVYALPKITPEQEATSSSVTAIRNVSTAVPTQVVSLVDTLTRGINNVRVLSFSFITGDMPSFVAHIANNYVSITDAIYTIANQYTGYTAKVLQESLSNASNVVGQSARFRLLLTTTNTVVDTVTKIIGYNLSPFTEPIYTVANEFTGYTNTILSETLSGAANLTTRLAAIRVVSTTLNTVGDTIATSDIYYRLASSTIAVLTTVIGSVNITRSIYGDILSIGALLSAGRTKTINTSEVLPVFIDTPLRFIEDIAEGLPFIGETVSLLISRNRQLSLREWLPATLDTVSKLLSHAIIVIQRSVVGAGNENIAPSEALPYQDIADITVVHNQSQYIGSISIGSYSIGGI